MKIHLLYVFAATVTALGAVSESLATIVVPTDQPTIQAAINAAIPGEEIIVLAGNYPEGLINVTTSVRLSGPNVSVSPGSPRAAEAIVGGGFAIMANDVVIQGFEIVGGVPHPNSPSRSQFVRSTQGLSGLDVSFNWIHAPNGTSASAIELGDNAGSQRSSVVTVASNIIDHLIPGGSDGISIWSADGVTVVGNVIRLETIPLSGGDHGGPGIVLDSVQGALVAKNDIDVGVNVFAPGSATYGIGVQATQADAANIQIVQNRIRHSGVGILSSSLVSAVRNLSIVRNDLEAVDSGISLQDFNIGSNPVSHDFVAMNQNRIAGGRICVLVVGLGATKTFSDVILRKNCFEAYGGALGVRGVAVSSLVNIPTHGGSLDARMNYWGAADGPSAVGTGSGLGVTNRVDFRRWLEVCPI